jgi:hypothetical protein
MSDPNSDYLDILSRGDGDSERVFRGVLRERESEGDSARQRLAAQRTWERQQRKLKRQQPLGDSENHEAKSGVGGEREAITLLPCPFCNGTPIIHFQLDDVGDYRAMCEGCGASSCPEGIRYSKDEAAADWNGRGGETARLYRVSEPNQKP